MNQRIKVTTLAGALIFFGSAHAEIYWYDANASPPLIHYTTPNGACYGIAQKLLTSYQAVSPQQHRIQALSLHAIDTNEYQCKITIYKRQFMWVPVIVAAPYSIIQGGENCLIAGRSDDNGFCGPRQPRNECNGSNPILGAFGNKYQNEEDGVLGSTVPIIFGRHYNHLNYGDVASMGAGWRNEYERKIIADDIDLSGTSFNPASVILFRQDGTRIRFTHDGSAWVSDSDVNYRLLRLHTTNTGTTGWRVMTPEGLMETYSATGDLLTVSTNDGSTITFKYDANFRLTSLTDQFGRQFPIIWNDSGRIQTVTRADGHSFAYEYDTDGNLTVVTNPDGTKRHYHYNEPHYNVNTTYKNFLTGITDENGNRYATFSYDAKMQAISSEHAGGSSKYTFDYLDDGTVDIINPIGSISKFSYASVNGVRLVSGRSQPGGSGCGSSNSLISYDAHGNVSSRQDFNGNLTQYTYDLARNLETQRREGLKSDGTARPETRTISTAWHAYWRLPVQVAEPNKITTYVYNGDTDPVTGTPLTCAPHSATLPSITGGTVPIGVLCRKTERATTDASGSAGFEASPTGLPRTWKWTYDAYGQMLTADGPRTDVNDLTTYAYYAANDPDPGKRGRLASITNALGQTTRITAYDLNGNPLAILDPNGVTTALAYDLRNHLIRRTVGDESTRYQYDGVGQLTRLTLPDGRYLAYTWDAAHRLTGIADALGNRIRYTLDAMGNRIREETQDPQGRLAQLRRHEYDALGRLAKSIGAQDQITQYEYDANGNHTRTTDPLAHITVNAYDALNRLIAITAPDKGYTLLAYDGQDRRIRVTDPRNLVTAYTLDGLGNHLQTRSPDTGVTVSTYDAAGNEITHTDAKGQITRTAYDALNRPIHITYADGRQTRYTWDAGTYGVGRLSRIDEVENGSITGSHQYAYDAQGRLRQETRTFGTLSHTTAYHYAGGQFSGMTLPSGRQVRYTRDAAGQITQVALTDIAPNAGQTRILASAIAYHPFGTIKRWTDGAGQTHTRSQDLDGRIDAYTLGSTLWRIHYDSAGRLVGQREEATPAQYGQYAYDALDRLISARLPEGSYGSAFDYAYDKAGNRIRQTMGGEARVHTIDTDSNRLLGITGRPEKAYTYDATGNRTGDGQNHWQYDARGRLVGLQGAAGAARYRVDALGRRVSKQVTGDNGLPVEVGYHYDQAGRLIAESDAQGNIRREYLWLEETPLAIVQ